MGAALYNKYRSRKMSEVIGQNHITTPLNNSLKNNKLVQAYLFTGPKGVGKTSVARIFAREINKLKYDAKANYIDIIEIDGASNNGVEQIRELVEQVRIAPTSAEYKVYIIDEVHMLSINAFNALLKTLEEPPKHVIFIIATTEAHKLPPTILSRVQRHNFHTVSSSDQINHLKNIADKEGVLIDDMALSQLAQLANGSFRDSINLLDQLSAWNKPIDQDLVRLVAGLPPKQQIINIMEAISNNNMTSLRAELAKPEFINQNPIITAQAFCSYILDKQNLSEQDTELVEQLLEIRKSSDPRLKLFLTLHRCISPEPSQHNTSVPKAIERSENKKTIELEVNKVTQKTVNATQKSDEAPDLVGPTVTEQKDQSPIISAQDIYTQLLELVKTNNNSLYTILRLSILEINGNTATINAKFAFHAKQYGLPKNKSLILSLLQSLNNEIEHLEIETITNDKAAVSQNITNNKTTVPTQTSAPQIDDISIINNLFGETEVID
jgi:DNA polymerase III subunit gamma/tau